MKYKNLIYDFDGTLSDTYPCFANAFVDTCKSFNVECGYKQAYDLLKISVGNAIKSFDFGCDYRKVSNVFHEFHDIRAVVDQKPFPEAEPLLRFVKEHGGRNFIYSHSGIIVMQLLNIWGWNELFDGVVDARTPLPRKPAPDGVNLICESYGLEKKDTIIVGDRDIDTDAGKNAGIDGCLFDPDGYYTSIDVTYRVNNLADIEKILIP